MSKKIIGMLSEKTQLSVRWTSNNIKNQFPFKQKSINHHFNRSTGKTAQEVVFSHIRKEINHFKTATQNFIQVSLKTI